MSKTAQDLIHDIDMLLLSASSKLRNVRVLDNPEELNARMYDALKCADAEMAYIYETTGQGCSETMMRVKYAIENYEKIQKAIHD